MNNAAFKSLIQSRFRCRDSPAKANRFVNASKGSIEKLLSTKRDDQIASKEAVITLRDTKGRPRRQYHHTLWLNRLQAYRAETLRVK